MANLVHYLEGHVRGDNPFGMDIVFVHSSFCQLEWAELPDFVVGMCVWDNYFMGWANRRCNTVTMNFNVRVFHVDHPPNACNDQNYNHFRRMSYASAFFEGFQEHSAASWELSADRKNLERRWRRESLELVM
jgi:hypothetical protein